MGSVQEAATLTDRSVDLERMVVTAICTALGDPAAKLDQGLSLDDLGCDSHTLAEIVLELEDHLGFEFSPEELDRFAGSATVLELIAGLEATRRMRAAA